MKILITGGAGFIGSNYVRQVMANSDDEVTVFDALTYAGNLSSLSEHVNDSRYAFVHGDVRDRGAVLAAMDGHDAVVHFAAETHVDNSLERPDDFVTTNCVGTNVVCDVARQVGVARVLHVSTDEVYGSIVDGSFVETDILTPSSPYSASKAGSDLIALSYHTTFGVPVVLTRSSNNFGPFQHPEKLIPLFITNLMDGRSVPLYGDGSNIRDWLFVEENCAGVDAVLRRGTPGETYNLGGGHELSNLEITSKVLALLGKDESSIERVTDRLGHDWRYSITSQKLQDLDWAPALDFDTALELTVQWYRDNRAWWEPLKRPTS
jgi:dTDP-glucose 4,6-dehydratase